LRPATSAHLFTMRKSRQCCVRSNALLRFARNDEWDVFPLQPSLRAKRSSESRGTKNG
jgi:hypothetical protein